MDTIIQALLTISILCAVHERFLEVLQNTLAAIPVLKVVSKPLTTGPWSVSVPVAMAILTRADVFLLFTSDGGKAGDAFFQVYGQSPEWLAKADWRSIFGCIVMGMCIALGSRFWHDLAYGLLDLRNGVKAAQADAASALASPSSPSPPGSPPASTPAAAKPLPAPAVPPAAFVTPQ
jgi:hypothetical protein